MKEEVDSLMCWAYSLVNLRTVSPTCCECWYKDQCCRKKNAWNWRVSSSTQPNRKTISLRFLTIFCRCRQERTDHCEPETQVRREGLKKPMGWTTVVQLFCTPLNVNVTPPYKTLYPHAQSTWEVPRCQMVADACLTSNRRHNEVRFIPTALHLYLHHAYLDWGWRSHLLIIQNAPKWNKNEKL